MKGFRSIGTVCANCYLKLIHLNYFSRFYEASKVSRERISKSPFEIYQGNDPTEQIEMTLILKHDLLKKNFFLKSLHLTKTRISFAFPNSIYTI